MEAKRSAMMLCQKQTTDRIFSHGLRAQHSAEKDSTDTSWQPSSEDHPLKSIFGCSVHRDFQKGPLGNCVLKKKLPVKHFSSTPDGA